MNAQGIPAGPQRPGKSNPGENPNIESYCTITSPTVRLDPPNHIGIDILPAEHRQSSSENGGFALPLREGCERPFGQDVGGIQHAGGDVLVVDAITVGAVDGEVEVEGS